MNEEEIIKSIKEMIQWSDHNTYKIALQGILDLYKQEKARNKDLEQIEKEHKEENGRLRDRIKELEEEKEKEFKRGFFTKVAENKVNTLKIESQVIPKSLVREKMNKIKEEDLEISNTDSEDVRIAKYEQIAILDFCEELLEESEK